MSDTKDRWQINAACRGLGPSLFYATDKADRTTSSQAKQICHTCPVSVECLQANRQLPEEQSRYGVWGGLTDDERRGHHTNRYR